MLTELAILTMLTILTIQTMPYFTLVTLPAQASEFLVTEDAEAMKVH